MNRDEEVKRKMQTIANKVKGELPEGYGFIVLAFQFGKGEGREMMYVSNTNREDVIKVMEEFAEKTINTYGNDTGKY